MTTRLDPASTHMDMLKPLIGFSLDAHKGIDPTIAELIKIRASQINGCGRCLVMHTRDARKAGETEERIYLLNAWRESPLFNERERAVLAWTEALTQLPATGVGDDVYEALRWHFSPEEQIKITLLIGAINTWNRINVAFHVGTELPVARKAA